VIRAVLDTNLLVSYLLTNGETTSRIIAHWEAGHFVFLQSPQTLTELIGVLGRPKLQPYLKSDPQILIDLIEADAEFVKGELRLPGTYRDPKDDKFIACAVEGNANYIVTGDNDLLDLGMYERVQIVTVREFLILLES
jgi:putative PIN family toxin of toxin-antitoxin system